MTKESSVLSQPRAVLPQAESLESAARLAFAEHVRLDDEEEGKQLCDYALVGRMTASTPEDFLGSHGIEN
jgi:hypothetical protein